MKTSTAIGIGIGTLALISWLADQRAKEPTINYVDKLPLNMSYNGIALPPVGIFIKAEHQGNEALLKHELMHWRQYQRDGLIPFYAKYLANYFTVGYDRHPMEIEARQAAGESQHCIENYTLCIRTGTAKTAYNPNFRL